MLVEELHTDTLQRLADSGDLSEHVDAIRAVLDHPAQTTNLALDATQARQQLLLVVGVTGLGRVHVLMIPPRGISANTLRTVGVGGSPLLEERGGGPLGVGRRGRPRPHPAPPPRSVRL